jgi:DNA-binding winged helix-turn-helix (wHTH) protein
MRIRFGDFTLDTDRRQLFKRDAEIHLAPKAFELLRVLVEARPKALAKAALIEHLWPKTFVAEANLSNLIAEIRHALGDDPQHPRFVRTAPRFGYAFCGTAVEAPAAAMAVRDSGTRYWLITATRRIALSEGENIVGRDPEVSVWLDLPGLSRRHARILIANDHATIEDLGSKNGTHLRGTRLTSVTELTDGDEIQLGPTLVTFRIMPLRWSTETQSIRGSTSRSN